MKNKPVVGEVPSHLSEVSAVAFLHILALVYSLHHVQHMLIWVLYVEVEPEGVQQNPFRSENAFSSFLQTILLSFVH